MTLILTCEAFFARIDSGKMALTGHAGPFRRAAPLLRRLQLLQPYGASCGRVSNRGDLQRFVGLLPCSKDLGVLIYSSFTEM